MAEELLSQDSLGAAPTDAAPSTPEVASAASPPPASAPPASSPEFTGIRDAFAPLGIDLSHLQDDQSAVQYLALQLQQARQLQQQASQYQAMMPNLGRYQQWEMQERQRQQEEATKKASWWTPAEYDPAWKHQVTRDAQGNLVPVPGAPADVVQKMQNFLARREQFEGTFYKDPIGALKPGLEQLINERASALIQQNMTQFQEQAYAQNFVREHSNWLYQKDASGQTVMDPMTGQPAFSPQGRAFYGHVQQAQQMGITNLQAQEKYARAMLAADLAQQVLARPQGQAAARPVDPRQALLQQHNRIPNAGGNLANPNLMNGGGSALQAGGVPAPLRSRIAQALQAAGATESDFKME